MTAPQRERELAEVLVEFAHTLGTDFSIQKILTDRPHPSARRQVLTDTGIDPTVVCLEVTESVLLDDVSRALVMLHEVKELGVRLSLDDFGTGYSSMIYLRKFPFDSVKLDRSFISDLQNDEVSRKIVGAIADLSHLLGLTVIAEGIESPAELTAVVDLGADQAQGFHFGDHNRCNN